MPSRNTIKHYIPEYYYHVYNRDWNRTEIFRDSVPQYIQFIDDYADTQRANEKHKKEQTSSN